MARKTKGIQVKTGSNDNFSAIIGGVEKTPTGILMSLR